MADYKNFNAKLTAAETFKCQIFLITAVAIVLSIP